MDMEIRFTGGKKVEAVYKGFTIKTDQPTHADGEGIAPEPFSLFLASIGTCVGYYVLIYCQNHNISTEGIKLLIKIEKNEATRMIEHIHTEIHVPKEFPQKYKNALIKAAESCTVKKHLEHPPVFHTTVTIQ